MKLYARTDTHYLLEIYDKLRVSLIESALANNEVDSTTYWKSVLSKSTEICATTFKKPKIE
jgi:ribonuclease D